MSNNSRAIEADVEQALAAVLESLKVSGDKPPNYNPILDVLSELVASCERIDLREAESIRTIHHLSCTGGTIITKCIASMSNTLVLNEIDLHSSLPTRRNQAAFTPTDVVSLLRQGDANISNELLSRIFISDLKVIRDDQWEIGRVVVLRDHSHSQFMTGSEISDLPTLRDQVVRSFPTRSVVTVRNPVDSYLSMQEAGWHKHFSPSTFDEYCRRYLIFLDRYRDVPIVKYEDFVESPVQTMRYICELLDLDYFLRFQEVFSSFCFSGDSGRTSGSISPRPRRDYSQDAMQEIVAAKRYQELCGQLDYAPVPSVS